MTDHPPARPGAHQGGGQRPTFWDEQGRLIDELRAARTTAAELAELAPSHEADFVHDVASRLAALLDDLGCCD